MTGPGDDITARVQRLEREVAQLRERLAESAGDAAAARVLASGADRDVSEVRAELRSHLRILNALRETQLEFQETQREFREELVGQRTQIVSLGEAQRELRGTQLEQGLQISTLREDVTTLRTEMREGFATVHTGMSHIVALLTNIERDQP